MPLAHDSAKLFARAGTQQPEIGQLHPSKPASAPAMASDRPPQPVARANHHAQQLVLPVVVTSYIGHLTPLLLERVRARCRPVELHGKGRVHLVCPGRCESGAHRLQTA